MTDDRARDPEPAAHGPQVPSPVDGKADGRPVAPVAADDGGGGVATPGAPAPEVALTPAASGLLGTPAAILAHLTGEPGSLPPTWCRKCEAMVRPVGKGKCERCGGFLRLNFVARTNPINKLRREVLLDEIVAEYRPRTLELRDACRFLANVKERLETTKDGTPEHQRLMAMWSELSIQLRNASRAERDAVAAIAVALEQLSTSELADRAEALTVRARKLADAEAEGAAYVARAFDEHRASAGLPVAGTDESPNEPEGVTAPLAAQQCFYCSLKPAACAALRDERPDVFYALHPIERQERDDQRANAEFRQIFGMDPR